MAYGRRNRIPQHFHSLDEREASTGSATQAAKCAATTASKALPPSNSICAAAFAVCSWPQATAPLLIIIEFSGRLNAANIDIVEGYIVGGLNSIFSSFSKLSLHESSID